MSTNPVTRRLPVRPTFSVEKVTPHAAKEWLTLNTRNRHLRPRRVAVLARDMRDGNWLMTAEPVKFATDGTLLDGQHRLAAVVESGATVEMAVVRNLPRETQDVMDTGSTRTAADQLGLAGYSNANVLAAAAKWLVIFDSGRVHVDRTQQGVTHSEINQTVESTPGLIDAIEITSKVRRDIDMPASVVAITYFLCSRADAADAHEFFQRVADGVGLPPGSPILALRKRLKEIQANRTRVDNPMLLSLTIRAWNAWRQGRAMSSIPLFKGGVTIHTPEPI